MHGGHQLNSGVRYILVCFVTVDAKFSQWAESFNQHIIAADGPADDEDECPQDESSAAEAEPVAEDSGEEEFTF